MPNGVSPTASQTELAQYAQAYIEAFNSLRAELEASGSPLNLYAKEISTVLIMLAKDGAVIFYVAEETRVKAGLEKGVGIEAREDETLSHFMQSGTDNMVKVWELEVGGKISFPPRLPDDVPLSELKGGINPEVYEPYLGQPSGPSLIGMGVGPRLQLEGGIFKGYVPTRGRIYSPIVNVPPDDRPLLQFIWPFADLLWDFKELHLKAESAREWARADIEVLKLGIAAGIPQKQLAEDPFEAVAAHCERACDELYTLIDKTSTKATGRSRSTRD